MTQWRDPQAPQEAPSAEQMGKHLTSVASLPAETALGEGD